ncbi:MAG TPA: histidine utilization repressor [Bryobacteraceae bacterium]|nr:histidine utilization repressor [Bryobacteraceae bacterium]
MSHVSIGPVPHGAPFALYERIKGAIRHKVRAGEWRPGDKIPSENHLAKTLKASRMTVNRALRELSEQGELVRRGGVGTFVAEPRPASTLLMIARIGDEIRARGHRYDWSVIKKSRKKASPELAAALDLSHGAPVFHVLCVHRENGVPVQLEDRYVNPVCVPRFLDQSFQKQPPSEYLLSVLPADEIEHTVDAVLPGAQARLLKVARDQPCLLLTRRTWSGNTPVTFARLLYPASRYRLGCRFKPSALRGRG